MDSVFLTQAADAPIWRVVGGYIRPEPRSARQSATAEIQVHLSAADGYCPKCVLVGSSFG
jgi:hypothetical protein